MAFKKKIQFIINPNSGIRSKKNLPAIIEQYLKKDLFDYELAFTRSAEHAVELAKEAVAEKKDSVIAAGGDGTLNLIAGSLVNTRVSLGIIPLGSGNGFARALKIPLKMEAAVQMLNTGKEISIDSGTANGKTFINVCGFGFDAHITSKFAEAGTRGFQTYARISIKEISSYKSKEYKIDLGNGEQNFQAFILAICNGPQYGSNAFIAPLAEFNDGEFDLTLLKEVSWRNMIGLTKDLFMRTLHQSKSVQNFKMKKAIITQPNEGFVNIDGEPIWFERKVEIILHPESLMIIVP